MWEQTLDRMAQGGMFDHRGWAAASAVFQDRKWLIRLRKMLYDNALLL
jgi:uncharacterized protein YyaL (SSP411 family)